MSGRRSARRRVGFESRLALLALAIAAPWIVGFLVLLFASPRDPLVRWGVPLLFAAASLLLVAILRHNVAYPLRTLANLLSSLREEDYSFRARLGGTDDAMSEVMAEVNELTEMLRERRLGALEASALVRAVIGEIDAAIFAFDPERKLRLVNRAGERLLARPAEALTGLTAEELALGDLLDADGAASRERSFPGGSGRWGIRQSTFRERGREHRLLLVADLSRALREEERQAWRRLLRVLGHELNNSLAPIKSIAASLESLVARDPAPDDLRHDLERGLSVIRARSEALTRFMEAYSRIARLPEPRLQSVELRPMLTRVAALERRLPVTIEPGPEATVSADPDQLEQLLINIVRNAVDAAGEGGGSVSIALKHDTRATVVTVRDDGPGLSGSSNLFVPFFTTKPGGSGLGLVLSRQIAEAHGGTLTLENRSDSRGCEAVLRLPAG
jgi:nitrogen fixation/metabolism regulation signal transduction histidine kinase